MMIPTCIRLHEYKKKAIIALHYNSKYCIGILPMVYRYQTAYTWYIETPIHSISTAYPWYIEPPTHGVSNPLLMVY